MIISFPPSSSSTSSVISSLFDARGIYSSSTSLLSNSITQPALTNEIVQCKTSHNDLCLSLETRHGFQYAPFILEDPKCSLNYIVEGGMQKFEYLMLPLRWTPTTMMKFWYMVCSPLKRCKVSNSVWITRIHKVVFILKIKIS
jgi:hypothetical protein